MMKELKNLLKEFGLTSNASKVYIALLRKSPSTGYEISGQADIPRSAIYNVLSRLVNMGLASSVGKDPRRYIPLPASSLIDSLHNKHNKRMDKLKSAIKDIDQNDEAFDFWHLHGYDNMIEKAKEVISLSSHSIAVSAWNREVKEIYDELKNAEKRGVKITIFSFTKIEEQVGNIISYDIKEDKLRKIWSPKMILVVDKKYTMMGSARNNDESRLIYTENQAILEIASDHLILDITLAGNRLGFDTAEYVAGISNKSDIDLESLLDKS
ncbi:TrmB family transcriptional regulator [bacterium]|jgi:HTH-type transcriptional regulator, sugar sensing transcriptional regulator|nr:TrmB family transcriptional regulator [bacterium]MBT4249027.1 TrmB family transcriptional regulator [bacterium]MBT4926775.1 TrmB family transcriptional regulator [bacterium]MBT5734173.1 TrmB family transcriptional regulator [bacterium]MBT6017886.1 TrmB family transcriptional regulator [bacterium]